jgi:hypothetical protein
VAAVMPPQPVFMGDSSLALVEMVEYERAIQENNRHESDIKRLKADVTTQLLFAFFAITLLMSSLLYLL